MIRLLKYLFNRKVLLTAFFFLIALAAYFLTIRSQGEVVSISIGHYGDKRLVVVPAYADGAVAWMEAHFVTDVPTHTPIPTNTPTPDLTHKPTKTPIPTKTQTPSAPTPTKTPKGTKFISPTPTSSYTPSLTPTTHSYFVGYGEPINTYNTYGRSKSAASLEIAGRLYLVIADGTHGLKIVDVTDPAQPLETRYTLHEANSVKVINTIAYIAAGKDGIVILDLSNPKKPVAIDQRATIGPAIDLDVYFRKAIFFDQASGATLPLIMTRIYVAMGTDGLQVITILPIARNPGILFKDKQTVVNKAYVKPVYFKTQDEVIAVSEAHFSEMNEFVFIADGKDGVKVLDLWHAYDRPIKQSEVIHSFDIAYAWDVAFVRLLEHRAKQDRQFNWLIVAAGKHGVYAYKVIYEQEPRDAVYNPIPAIDTPGEARSITVYHNNIFVGDGEGGVQVIDFNDPDHPVLMGNGRYEFDWNSIPIIYALKQWVWKNIESPGSAATIANVAFDGLLCIGSLVVMAFFLTGLVLPARTISDRFQVLRRVLANWLNAHGPAWVIEDGQPRYRTPVAQRHGVGVSLQDPNSAMLLDQHQDQPRVSGDQLTFTGSDEHLVWQTELRRRQLIVGPRHDDADPFRIRENNEERGEYRARLYRKRMTLGKTSDGVAMVATLRVVYSLEGTNVNDQDEFGYDPNLVERMYKGERPFPFDRNADPVKYWRRRQPIEAMLEKLVSEVWKLNVNKYTMSDLFPPLHQTGTATALQTIQQMLTDLLVNRQENALSGFETTAEIVAIREDYRELAGGKRSGGRAGEKTDDPGRGVRVHEVRLEGISISDDDTQRLLQQWIDAWRQGNPPQQPHQPANTAQEALIQFAEYAVQFFKDQSGGQVQIQRLVESLVRLLKGTLRALPPGEDRNRLSAAIRRLGGGE